MSGLLAIYLFHMGSRPVRDEKNPSECMQFGCRLPIAVVSQAYPKNAEMCPGFPPPQAALITAAAGNKVLWVVWCSNDKVRLRQKGGKSSVARLNNVRIIMVGWWASILSLGSGDGIPVLVG